MSCRLNTIAKSNCEMARQIMTLWKYNTHCITHNIGPSSMFTVINLLSPQKLCQTHLLRNSPERLNPSTKKPGVLNWKCLGLYVTRQLIWRQTPKLCVTVYWNKIYTFCCKARQRLKENVSLNNIIGYITNSQWPALKLAWLAQWTDHSFQSLQRSGFDSQSSTSFFCVLFQPLRLFIQWQGSCSLS